MTTIKATETKYLSGMHMCIVTITRINMEKRVEEIKTTSSMLLPASYAYTAGRALYTSAPGKTIDKICFEASLNKTQPTQKEHDTQGKCGRKCTPMFCVLSHHLDLIGPTGAALRPACIPPIGNAPSATTTAATTTAAPSATTAAVISC